MSHETINVDDGLEMFDMFDGVAYVPSCKANFNRTSHG